MKSVTVSKTSTYYLQITDTVIMITAGELATVTISSPIPYSINNKPTLKLLPTQSVVIELSGKNFEATGFNQANTIPNLISGRTLSNDGEKLLWLKNPNTKTVEVDFGSASHQTTGVFNFKDSDVTTSSNISVQKVLNPTSSGRSLDECWLQQMDVVAKPNNGSVDLYIQSLCGSLNYQFVFSYQIT